MKKTKTALPVILILAGMVLTVLVNLVICVAQKPVITEYRFPFSITYEFGGNTVTIEDEFVCTYTGHGQSVDPADRFYDGVYAHGTDETACGEYLIQAYEDGELVLLTNFFPGYMMGDPQYADHYTPYYRYEPYIAFYVYEEYIEYSDEEILAPYNVRILDWEYPEPLENSFTFSKITRLTGKNVLPMVGISLLTLLACVIFVKKDPDLTVGAMDRAAVILNFAMGLVVLPFLTVVGFFTDINGSGADLLSQICFCVPGITGFGLAASVCLRRKGFRKAGFAAQFAGIAVMILILAAEAVF